MMRSPTTRHCPWIKKCDRLRWRMFFAGACFGAALGIVIGAAGMSFDRTSGAEPPRPASWQEATR